MIFIKKIIHTAIRQIGKTFRLTQHIPGHHNRDKRLPIHTTNSNAIRIVVNNLYGHSSESNHYLPPFASSLIMHVLTNAEKLIPRRDAASLAESRKLAGIRIVTGTTSPFTRYERISVSPASCSIRSEYVIAFYTFKLQYKCNNSTPAWEQRKFVDFVEASGIRNKDNLQLESYSVSNDRGFVPQDEQFENGGTMRDADKTAYWIVEPGSFAYNPARINVGSIGYQSTRKNVIVSSLYEVFKTDRSCDDRFLWHWFKSSLFTKQIEMLQEGGVRLYFFFDKLQKSEIWMPNVDEQRIIGQQFRPTRFFNHPSSA